MHTETKIRPAENLVIRVDFDEIAEDETELREVITQRVFTIIRARIKERMTTTALQPGGYFHGGFSASVNFESFQALYKVSRQTDGSYHLHVLIAPPGADALFDWLDDF